MQIKIYEFKGKSFTDTTTLGRFVRQESGVSFSNPADDAGWEALGVVISTKDVVMPTPIEPTDEDIQEQLTQKVQAYLDAEAKALNYDSCLSVCSYVETGVSKFDDEGKAFRAWRSAVWAKGYEIVAAVKAGTRTVPTEEELFAELPKLTVIYGEEATE